MSLMGKLRTREGPRYARNYTDPEVDLTSTLCALQKAAWFLAKLRSERDWLTTEKTGLETDTPHPFLGRDHGARHSSPHSREETIEGPVSLVASVLLHES